MIVRSRGLLAAFAVLLAAAAFTPLSAQKVGYVDSRKILQDIPGRAQVETALRTEIEKLGAREKKMVDSLNALMSAFERDSASLSQPERVTRFTAMQAYDGLYRDTLEVLEAEAQQLQAQAMAPLFDQIRIALEDIRQADGYAMIFDVGGQVNPIVAMDKNLDLSDRVIARLRTMPATARPTPAAPPAKQPPGPVGAPAGVRRP
jgi:Skp family chaperone for outer membrane proteins